VATIYQITNGLQTVNAAGAVTGTLDVSSLAGDYTLKIRVAELGDGKVARIAVEDTADGTNPFNDALPVALVHVKGPVAAGADKVFSFKSYQLVAARFGGTNNKFRCNVLSCSSTPGLKVQAWLEK
jgi:hypothetical protein